jgi:hypothetical protein
MEKVKGNQGLCICYVRVIYQIVHGIHAWGRNCSQLCQTATLSYSASLLPGARRLPRVWERDWWDLVSKNESRKSLSAELFWRTLPVVMRPRLWRESQIIIDSSCVPRNLIWGKFRIDDLSRQYFMAHCVHVASLKQTAKKYLYIKKNKSFSRQVQHRASSIVFAS